MIAGQKTTIPGMLHFELTQMRIQSATPVQFSTTFGAAVNSSWLGSRSYWFLAHVHTSFASGNVGHAVRRKKGKTVAYNRRALARRWSARSAHICETISEK